MKLKCFNDLRPRNSYFLVISWGAGYYAIPSRTIYLNFDHVLNC